MRDWVAATSGQREAETNLGAAGTGGAARPQNWGVGKGWGPDQWDLCYSVGHGQNWIQILNLNRFKLHLNHVKV
jgi:hypothetical protein